MRRILYITLITLVTGGCVTYKNDEQPKSPFLGVGKGGIEYKSDAFVESMKQKIQKGISQTPGQKETTEQKDVPTESLVVVFDPIGISMNPLKLLDTIDPYYLAIPIPDGIEKDKKKLLDYMLSKNKEPELLVSDRVVISDAFTLQFDYLMKGWSCKSYYKNWDGTYIFILERFSNPGMSINLNKKQPPR
ncbi:MAG: hypothetical protein HY606_09785 [Planctomycetes bacterium]|nr:hypothetical protein [Planctomycetota bacterium]